MGKTQLDTAGGPTVTWNSGPIEISQVISKQLSTLKLTSSIQKMSLKVPKANNVQIFKEGYKVYILLRTVCYDTEVIHSFNSISKVWTTRF